MTGSDCQLVTGRKPCADAEPHLGFNVRPIGNAFPFVDVYQTGSVGFPSRHCQQKTTSWVCLHLCHISYEIGHFRVIVVLSLIMCITGNFAQLHYAKFVASCQYVITDCDFGECKAFALHVNGLVCPQVPLVEAIVGHANELMFLTESHIC